MKVPKEVKDWEFSTTGRPNDPELLSRMKARRWEIMITENNLEKDIIAAEQVCWEYAK